MESTLDQSTDLISGRPMLTDNKPTLNELYQAQLFDLERQLNPYQFPVEVELSGRNYLFYIWDGQHLPDRMIAIDTETELIQGRAIPRMAIAAAHGDAGSCFFIHPSRLAEFIIQHQTAYWVAHNAVFDFWVIAQQLANNSTATAAWWDIAARGQLLCTMLLDAVLRLARFDHEPVNRNLGVVAYAYAGVTVDKDDPYRLRYGELLDLPVEQWNTVVRGFWEYGGCDPIATLLVAQEQIREATDRIAPHSHQLLEDAVERFGPLTACLQVQGAIALDYISRVGICIDAQDVAELRGAVERQVSVHMKEIEELGGGDLFKRKKSGEYMMAAKSGIPSRNAKTIKQKLEEIAAATEEPIIAPRNADGLVTDSAKFWKEHWHVDPFIAAYVQYIEQSTLMKFFRQLEGERIYPKYEPLKRTGRSSCRDPNLQNIPRDPRFREMFKAPDGYWLLQIDYSVQELRTLAQVCLNRYGHSVLAELFQQGIDPHRYTAALFAGLTMEQFNELPKDEQKTARQRSKSLNFGVPGGLGAKSLTTYAKQVYGIDITLEEAKEFRHKLITEVYPELELYLKDNAYDTLARNIKTTIDNAKAAFPTWSHLRAAFAVVSGELAEDDDSVTFNNVWLTLRQYSTDPSLQDALQLQQPSYDLARRIFNGHAVTLSGRIRGHVSFSQRMNSPFQGLAADGNKLAMFTLLRHGYQICGFVHDEMLILIPKDSDYDFHVARVQQILHDAMAEFTPDVEAETEFLLADRWYKNVDEQPRDREGHILPYSRDNPFPDWERHGPIEIDVPKHRPKLDPDQIDSFCILDIVDRLRKWQHIDWMKQAPLQDMLDAADEISTLRTRITALTAQVEYEQQRT